MQSPVQPHPPQSQPQVMQPLPHAMQAYPFDGRATEGVVSAGGEVEGISHNPDSGECC